MFIFEKLKKNFDFVHKLFNLFDHKEKIQFSIVMLVSLFLAVFQAVGVASILPFINMVMDPNIIAENRWLSYFFNLLDFKSNNSFIIFFGFFVLAVLVIGNLISAFATWFKIHFVWRKNHTLSTLLLKKYLSMPYTYFLNQNSTDLGKNVLAEVQQVTNGFLLSLISVITNSIIIIVILALLLYVNLSMTLGVAGFLVLLYFLIYFYFSDKLNTGGEERVLENKGRFKTASEALGGIKDIKILGVEKFFLQKFSKHSDKFSYLQSWYQVIGQVPRYIMEMVAFGGIVSLLIFLVYSNTPTDRVIPLVSFFAFAGYRLIPALQEIFNSLTSIKFNEVVLDNIYKDMNEESPIADDIYSDHKKNKPLSFKEKIKLENIYFTYPNNERVVLRNINLEIKKNTFIALIGITGSGKTTLVDLMLGLLSPDKGSFSVDGVEINKDNIKNWQANLGYVPQQIYLSDDTILRNIAFGVPDKEIDMNKVEKVAQMANIHDFISKELHSGYQEIIGERGIRLSGGQRQRIGIARALYHDPQILLLDEATSSLDNKTEKEVLDAIEGIAKLKTIIVIAHRLTTVKNCDKVYVVDKGKIIDEGSYDEVVNIRQKLSLKI